MNPSPSFFFSIRLVSLITSFPVAEVVCMCYCYWNLPYVAWFWDILWKKVWMYDSKRSLDWSEFSLFPSQLQKKLRVLVKPLEKPKVVLKFVWMQKDIGVALDHMIPGFGTIPLSPYYFWPRKDAWEELKALLESKPWISELHRVFLLNQATDIINLWQSSGGDFSWLFLFRIINH